MKQTAAGKLYEQAWKHDNPKVRQACLYLLTKGAIVLEDTIRDSRPDNAEVWHVLEECGCRFEYGKLEQGMYLVTADGVHECYGNGELV